MQRWIPYAMVRITAFFIGGILLGIYQPCLSVAQASILTFPAILLFSILSLTTFSSFKKGMGALGLLIIFMLGYLQLIIHNKSNDSNHLLKTHGTIEAYTAIVRSAPEEKTKSWKVEVEADAVKMQQWKRASGKFVLYVEKQKGELPWRYGDRLLIEGAPQPLKPPANPGEFDFRRFLSFRNAYHQQYVKRNEVKWLSSAQHKGFIYYAHEARFWATQQIQTHIEGKQEQAIAMALVLGVTEGIDNELQNAYAASGAMHVLAVSGLHVGILYAIILLLLKPISKYAWSRWAVAVISILSLWIFAFVTGLSPSVLRAVTMFSFVALARPFGWRTNIYNTLAASAFVLLLYNPYLIMSVGFQLSYLAVLGIVYGQGPIYHLLEFKSFLGDWVWKITCISLAAQLATFPLGLLYFHQFPTYFLISNLFVIPISTLILVLGIVLLGVSSLSGLASFVGWITGAAIKLLNGVVFQTEQLPLSLINGIHFTTFQCWLLIGFILMLVLLFESKKIIWLYAATVITLILSIARWLHFTEDIRHPQFIVYAIQNHRAVEWIERGHSFLYADSSLLADEERIKFHIRPNRLDRGIIKTDTSSLPSVKVKGITVFHWRTKTFGILAEKCDKLPRVKLDYLIIGHNAIRGFESLKDFISARQIVLDGTNTSAYRKKIIQFCASQNIPIHSVLDQNAFIVTTDL